MTLKTYGIPARSSVESLSAAVSRNSRASVFTDNDV